MKGYNVRRIAVKNGAQKAPERREPAPVWGREMVDALVREHPEMTVVVTWRANKPEKKVRIDSGTETGASHDFPIAPAA